LSIARNYSFLWYFCFKKMIFKLNYITMFNFWTRCQYVVLVHSDSISSSNKGKQLSLAFYFKDAFQIEFNWEPIITIRFTSKYELSSNQVFFNASFVTPTTHQCRLKPNRTCSISRFKTLAKTFLIDLSLSSQLN
jgi:hypothetical protein